MNKFLPILFSPIFLVLILILAGMVSRRRIWLGIAAMLLFLGSLPGIVDPIYDRAQGNAVKRVAAALPATDAIVVLGGAVSYVPGTVDYAPEWGDSVDRLLGGVELWRAGRSSRLFISGGLPNTPSGALSEGEVAREFVIALGVDPSAIVIFPSAENTVGEARVLRQGFGGDLRSITLVTSAFHMPRASMVFRQFGFAVEEFPVDLRLPLRRSWTERWLPSAQAIMKADIVVRELVGRAYYRLVFWLEPPLESR
jgi:uncharacterized SAM-binding protein YcdF (DUF218 family)